MHEAKLKRIESMRRIHHKVTTTGLADILGMTPDGVERLLASHEIRVRKGWVLGHDQNRRLAPTSLRWKDNG